MIKQVLTYPKDKDILTLKSEEVKDINCEETKTIIQDLRDTLATDPTGVGISAIQIGVPKRICIINYGQEIVMINPVITWKRSGANGMKKFKEGCLSAPGVYTEVLRPQKVICQYTNENGEIKEIGEGGWMSAIIQHELDHFEGYCEVFDAVKGE